MENTHTQDGQPVTIHTRNKPGMSVFVVFGDLAGKPCHWTAEGRYRMDGQADHRDLV
jgi:hypothetical protein